MIGLRVVGNPEATVTTSSPGTSRRSPSFGLVSADRAHRFADEPLLTKDAWRAPTYPASELWKAVVNRRGRAHVEAGGDGREGGAREPPLREGALRLGKDLLATGKERVVHRCPDIRWLRIAQHTSAAGVFSGEW